jgi:multicomponent Na+:H+ antiporter subunit D
MAGEAGTYVDISRAMIMEPVALADWLLVAPVAIAIFSAAVLVMIRRRTNLHAPISVISLALILASEALLIARVMADGPVVMTMGRWLPPFGITFVADMLGLVLAATAALVAIVCALYSQSDVDNTGRRYGFHPFLLLMTAGVTGSFLTGDIFNLYVWFEIFLISSFGLIVLGSERRQLDGAVKYAILNLIATTLFLLTTGLLYGAVGTLNMADIALKVPELRGEAPLMTIAMLYFVAFGMKAAAFPLSFWLPASYHTPKIVVGALFGALLTKVGVYALLRAMLMLFPQETGNYATLITWVAVATMILAALGALAQNDIRRTLGFLVVSGIGLMLAGLALASPLGVTGTIAYAIHSMLVMAALYLLVGVMGRYSGTFALTEIGGLYRPYPLLAGVALLLVLSIAGLPPGSGLWPKVYLVRASIEAGSWLLVFAILINGLLTTLAMGRVFAFAFWRPKPAMSSSLEAPGAIPASIYAMLFALAIPLLILGLYPEPILQLAEAAASGLLEPMAYIGGVLPGGGGS